MNEELKKENKKKYMQEYLKKHKEEKKAYMKKYFQNLSEEKRKKRNEYMKKWYKENKDIRKGYYEAHRKECAEYSKSRLEKIRCENIEFLIKKRLITDCIICGFPKEKFAAIDFHHIDPKEKEVIVSKLIDKTDKAKLEKEASKCVCMCRNCHNLYHAGDKEIIEKFNKHIDKTGGKR